MDLTLTVEGAARRLEHLLGASSQRELAAALIGAIALAGSLFGFATYALPHPEGTNFVAPSIGFAAAIVYGAVVLARRREVSWTTIAVGAALGSVVVTVAMISVPGRTGAYASFYVWIGIFAFYFLRPGVALAQVAWIGVLYAAAVAVDAPPGAVELWINGVMTTLGVGLLVLALRTRISGLIESLERSARTDELTELPNRRAYDEQIGRQLAGARRSGLPVSLLLIDLDNFKEVNDSGGHLAGDGALRTAADVIRSQVRPSDWPARIGGDEFAVILAGASEEDALRVGARVCARIEERFAHAAVALTASGGVAETRGAALDAETLARDADRALYGSKRLGGGRALAASALKRDETSGLGGERAVSGGRLSRPRR